MLILFSSFSEHELSFSNDQIRKILELHMKLFYLLIYEMFLHILIRLPSINYLNMAKITQSGKMIPLQKDSDPLQQPSMSDY